MLLLFPSAIFRSVFSNTLVMKVVSLPTNVNVANLHVVVVVCLFGVVILLGGGVWVAGVDRESAVKHDAVDGVLFYSVFVFVQVVCV